MSRTLARAAAIALAVALVLAPSAGATDEVRREGSCSGGPGHWILRVRRDGGLRVRFRISEVPAGQSWQLFLSDNGTRIYTGTKTSTAQGEVRVSRAASDRLGSDRIAASGVNTWAGTSCEGSLTF